MEKESLTVIYRGKSRKIAKNSGQWLELLQRFTGVNDGESNVVGVLVYYSDRSDTISNRVYEMQELGLIDLEPIKQILLLPDFRYYGLGKKAEAALKTYPQTVLVRSSSISLITDCLSLYHGQCGDNQIFVDYLNVPNDDLEYSVFYQCVDDEVEPTYIVENKSQLVNSIKNWLLQKRPPRNQKCDPPKKVQVSILTTVEDMIPSDLHRPFFLTFPYSVKLLAASQGRHDHLKQAYLTKVSFKDCSRQPETKKLHF